MLRLTPSQVVVNFVGQGNQKALTDHRGDAKSQTQKIQKFKVTVDSSGIIISFHEKLQPNIPNTIFTHSDYALMNRCLPVVIGRSSLLSRSVLCHRKHFQGSTRGTHKQAPSVRSRSERKTLCEHDEDSYLRSFGQRRRRRC